MYNINKSLLSGNKKLSIHKRKFGSAQKKSAKGSFNKKRSTKKTCNKKNKKSTNKMYKCNTKTGRWNLKSIKKKSRRGRKMSQEKCKKILQKKIRINIDEFKNKKFKSIKQAIAVAYNQVKKNHNCDFKK